jgi:hypothetical protein
MAEKVLEAFKSLHKRVEQAGYKGYEFDDLLGSPVLKPLAFGNLFLQRVIVQIGELWPVNFRPLVGVRQLESTKARGFFARGYLYAYLATQDERWLGCARKQLDWLLIHGSPGFEDLAWGNAFDFASRGGFFPKDLPTIVWTSHIAATFLLAHEICGEERYLDALGQSCRFIVTELPRHEDDNGICFAYAPGLMNLVHNSNLLGAATLLRGWQHFGIEEYRKLAERSYQWTLAHANSDASWYYGIGRRYRWIDNHHMAYVIDCLVTADDIAPGEIVDRALIKRSYRYWTSNFFLKSGLPRFYPNARFPADIQCASQAIESLAKLSGRFSDALPLAKKVANWTIDNMQKPNGGFRYQIRQFWRNNLESIHWGQSTMLAALGALYYYASKHSA